MPIFRDTKHVLHIKYSSSSPERQHYTTKTPLFWIPSNSIYLLHIELFLQHVNSYRILIKADGNSKSLTRNMIELLKTGD